MILDRLTQLPVLPEGLHWHVTETTERHNWTDFSGVRRMNYRPVYRVSIQMGTVSRNGYSGLSQAEDSMRIRKPWHWLVRLAARRMYKRTIVNGEVRVKIIPKPWNYRYDLVNNFRIENGYDTTP